MGTMEFINIIGAGLAGCEAAYQAAKRGIKVRLFECKPAHFSDAHTNPHLCELVCSNSLKSTDTLTASGLLKEEMRFLDSLILSCAEKVAVPAGGALAVDRNEFSALVTRKIKENPNIEIINGLIECLPQSGVTVIATGPLTVGKLNGVLNDLSGGCLAFYDAAAPIVDAQSIDYEKTFSASRYNKGGESDYINCPLSKAEYELFVNELINAETILRRDFEKGVFEGCMPVEIMAKRGGDTLRFGPMRPVGFIDPVSGKRPYAVVQLRKENTKGTMFNIVGFQTNLKFNEQKRVFSMIPALQKAEFLRYGVMHRNTFINAPKTINKYFQCLKNPQVFIAGQLSGVEGYMESAVSGLLAGINASKLIKGELPFVMPANTISGELARFLEIPNGSFQPMNANFGLLQPIEGKFKDKNLRKLKYYERATQNLNTLKPEEYI